jgi:hypothetical protein
MARLKYFDFFRSLLDVSEVRRLKHTVADLSLDRDARRPASEKTGGAFHGKAAPVKHYWSEM